MVGQYVVATVPLVAAAAWVVVVLRTVERAESAALESFDGDLSSESEHARLHNVAEGLCLSMGIGKPVILIVRESKPFAAVLSAKSGTGTILVSEGFVEVMDRMEHEAVIAQLLSRLRSGDSRIRTEWMVLRPLLSRFGLSFLAQKLGSDALAATPDITADEAACRATRYPPALVSALEKVLAAGAPGASAATSPSWFAVPVVGDAGGVTEFRSLNPFYSAVGERIEHLKESYQC